MDSSMGPIQLVPNPDFVFPARSDQNSSASSPQHRRPVSMHLSSSPAPSRPSSQRKSVSTLPTFTFNANDTSGMGHHSPELPSSSVPIPVTPSRAMGHRRRASEFVGGDSRYGVSTLVSTSPSKLPETLPVPSELPATGSPSRRRGHAHRRSAAISGHDLASILQPRDTNVTSQVEISSSPVKDDHWAPLQTPSYEEAQVDDSVAPAPSTLFQPDSPLSNRPPSRPRVGFSENVEYIPRPLSTVSSDTTSSASTVRGHSVTNSISSMISLGGVGTPSPRRSRTLPRIDLRPATQPVHRSSLDSTPVQSTQDVAWRIPRQPQSSQSVAGSPKLSITIDAPDAPRLAPKKRSFLKLDRRRSEPLISACGLEQTGLSTVSLQDPVMSGPFLAQSDGDEAAPGTDLSRKSSRKRVKDWANAFLGRRARDPRKTKSMVLSPDMFPATDPTSQPERGSDAELDLDAVFGQDPFGPEDGMAAFCFSHNHSDPDLLSIGSPDFSFDEVDDPSSIIDLDAALGPHGTPSMSGGRRQMHSGGFGRRGGHNRTYSLPTLTPFKYDRSSSPVQSSMADVFEEDEEAEVAVNAKDMAPGSSASEVADSDDESGTGIQIVDAVLDDGQEEQGACRSAEHGLGIQRGEDSAMLALPMVPTTMRRKSVVEETIMEEASPIEIVEDHEEPRTSSVTKSSDSSDTSTILADQLNVPQPVPSAEPSPLSPFSYATSTFSSPDYHNQQGFFDPSRLGTSGSSMTDNRTVSSFGQCDHALDPRTSVEDVPSLTSSRSTMTSAMHHTFLRRDFSDRSGSVVSVPLEVEMSERRRKRSSIQSLSKLVGAQFGDGRTRSPSGPRPQTAVPMTMQDGKRRKENRLSKLMFWRSKGECRSVSSSK